jgi:capsular polysaccharide biosynthesis protein
LAVPFAINQNQPSTYSAHARLSLDVPDPTSSEESTAIADTARAMATSTDLVSDAINQAQVAREAAPLAETGVSVEALGTSGVLELTVADRDPKAASSIANALAKEVIEARSDANHSRVIDALREIGNQISAINLRVVEIDQAARGLSPTRGVALADERRELSEQRADLEAQRESLLSFDITRPEAAIIDLARIPTEADPTSAVPEIALGGLLGLLLGVGFAALLEAVRPTIVGGSALAHTFDAPVLGHLPDWPRRLEEHDALSVGARVRLAARAAGVETVELVAGGKSKGLDSLAEQLLDPPELSDVSTVSSGENGDDPATDEDPVTFAKKAGRAGRQGVLLRAEGRTLRTVVRPFDPVRSGSQNGSAKTGVVVVAPTVVSANRLEETRDLLSTIGCPVLGVITFHSIQRSLIDRRLLGESS